MCCSDCRRCCCKPDRDEPAPKADPGDEMLSGDEFIKRWHTPELSGPAA